MNILSNKSVKKYFLTKNSKIDETSKVNLVLSPEFYWVRVFDIPVKNEKKAIKVLPSLFEDILPNASFDYYAVQLEKNKFICFAFNNDEILTAIKNSGLNLSLVNNVFFAQTQMRDYKSFIVNDSAFIYDNDILIKIPKVMCSDAKEISNQLDRVDDNNHKLNMKFYSNNIGSKYIYTLVALLFCICVLNAVKYFSINKQLNLVESKIEKIRTANNMPKTQIQTNSILEYMEKNVREAKEFKEAFSYIFEYREKTNTGSIETIDYRNNTIKIVFKDVDWSKIKRHIEKKFSILNSNTNGNFISIEVKI